MTRVSLRDTSVGDEGFAHLARMTRMKFLSVSGTRVGDGLAHLAGMSRMGSSSQPARVSDAGLADFARMAALENTGPLGTAVQGPGLIQLEPLGGLLELHLSGTRIGNTGLAHYHGSPCFGSQSGGDTSQRRRLVHLVVWTAWDAWTSHARESAMRGLSTFPG